MGTGNMNDQKEIEMKRPVKYDTGENRKGREKGGHFSIAEY